jgi:hypothetical protein
MNIRLLVLLAGAAAGVWSVRRWREAVKVAMVLLIVEGALRKWVFPGAQDLIYFAKDVLLLGAYAGFLRQRGLQRDRPPANPLLYGVLVLAALLGLLQILNPNLPNLLVGILGFKAYFFYVPLLFVLPAVFQSDAELYQFLRRYALLAIPVGLLAVFQFFSPSASAINTYAWRTEDLDYVATFGSSTYVRVTGPFSFITGFTSYLLANAILLLCLLGQARWRLRGHFLLYAALGLTLLSIFMSGSRGPVLFLSLLFPLYGWLVVLREGGRGATFGRLLIGIGLLVAFLTVTGEEAFSAFYGRASGSTDLQGRLIYPFTIPFKLLPIVGFAGYGIGATHQAALAVAKGVPAYSWLHGVAVEAETGRIMIELGGLGFLLVYFIRLYMPFYSFLQIWRLRTRFHRTMATASFLFYTSQILGMVIFDVTAGLYYWFFGGLLLTVMKLDRQMAIAAAREAAAARQAAAPPPAPVPAQVVPWQRKAPSQSS